MKEYKGKMLKKVSIKREELKKGNVYWDDTFTFLRDDGSTTYGDFVIFLGFVKDNNKNELAHVKRVTIKPIGNLKPVGVTEEHLVTFSNLYEL